MTIQQSNFKILTHAILLLIFIIVSCKTNKNIQISNTEIETNYNESFKGWNKLKKTHNDSYEYEVSYASWIGYRNTTKIVVKNGRVISREFLETQQNDQGGFTMEEIKVFKENESNINTNEEGFNGVTIDQVYNDCGTKSLQVNEAENNLYFTTDDSGILKSCGYTPKNCADDCSRGVYVSKFNWLD